MENFFTFHESAVLATSSEELRRRLFWGHIDHLSAIKIPLDTLKNGDCYSNTIRHLTLTGCRLKAMPIAFTRLDQLESLDFSCNKLQTVRTTISRLTTLNVLNLSLNPLHQLPPEFGCMPALATLNLEEDDLTTLPDAFSRLTSLTDLNISYNLLQKIPPGLVGLPSLESLEIQGNPVIKIDMLPETRRLTIGHKQIPRRAIKSLTRLELLSICCHGVSFSWAFEWIPCGLRGLCLLQWPFSHVPYYVMQLTALTQLDLSNGSLRKLPANLDQLTALTTLDVSHNALRYLPASITRLTALTTLAVGSNSLSHVPVGISRLTNLTYLNLMANPFTTVPAELGMLTRLTFLALPRAMNIPLAVAALPVRRDHKSQAAWANRAAAWPCADRLIAEFLISDIRTLILEYVLFDKAIYDKLGTYVV